MVTMTGGGKRVGRERALAASNTVAERMYRTIKGCTRRTRRAHAPDIRQCSTPCLPVPCLIEGGGSRFKLGLVAVLAVSAGSLAGKCERGPRNNTRTSSLMCAGRFFHILYQTDHSEVLTSQHELRACTIIVLPSPAHYSIER